MKVGIWHAVLISWTGFYSENSVVGIKLCKHRALKASPLIIQILLWYEPDDQEILYIKNRLKCVCVATLIKKQTLKKNIYQKNFTHIACLIFKITTFNISMKQCLRLYNQFGQSEIQQWLNFEHRMMSTTSVLLALLVLASILASVAQASKVRDHCLTSALSYKSLRQQNEIFQRCIHHHKAKVSKVFFLVLEEEDIVKNCIKNVVCDFLEIVAAGDFFGWAIYHSYFLVVCSIP